MVGAMLGAMLAWLAYKKHFDDPEAEPDAKLGVFCTDADDRLQRWNLVTEVDRHLRAGLRHPVLRQDPAPRLGPLAVALLVVGIGASLGGPTGYAINPARDLGPRIMHALLPIPGKGSSGWHYAWVPGRGADRRRSARRSRRANARRIRLDRPPETSSSRPAKWRHHHG